MIPYTHNKVKSKMYHNNNARSTLCIYSLKIMEKIVIVMHVMLAVVYDNKITC